MCRTAIKPAETPLRSHIARADRAVLGALGLSLAFAGTVRPVQAQISGSLILASDDRLRGYSVSNGRPTASIALGYDAPSGLYVDGAATIASRPEALVLTGASVDAGYAWRTANAVVIDVGVTRRQFTRYANGRRATGYGEIYAGAGGRNLSARLSYSPDYFAAGVHNLYGSLDGAVRADTKLRFTAHAGLNVYLSPVRIAALRSVQYDVSVGAARRTGPIDVRLEMSSGGPNADYFSGRRRTKTAVVVSTAIVF